VNYSGQLFIRNQTITEGFLKIFLCMYFIQHCFICRPSDITVPEDAGIEQYTIIMPCNVLSSKPAGLLKDYAGSALKNPRKACCEEWTSEG
jgi:hypothetical protein